MWTAVVERVPKSPQKPTYLYKRRTGFGSEVLLLSFLFGRGPEPSPEGSLLQMFMCIPVLWLNIVCKTPVQPPAHGARLAQCDGLSDCAVLNLCYCT